LSYCTDILLSYSTIFRDGFRLFLDLLFRDYSIFRFLIAFIDSTHLWGHIGDSIDSSRHINRNRSKAIRTDRIRENNKDSELTIPEITATY